MKGNSNLKQGTVFLMAFVLVVGLAGLGGQVYGDSDSDSSDITVNAVEVEIEVHALEQGYTDLTDDSNAVDSSSDEDIDLEVLISLDDGSDSDIEDISADFDWDGTGDVGDAVNSYSLEYTDFDQKDGEEWETDGDETTEDQAIYEASLTIDDMMRYGEFGHWTVEAAVEDTGANTDDDDQDFAVSTFVEIQTSGQISGTAAPGQTLNMDGEGDNEREWTEKDSITTFRINSMYNIDSEMTDLEGETTEDSIPSGEYENTGYWLDGDSDNDIGDHDPPIDSELDEHDSIEPQNEVFIPEGTLEDTYNGEVYHTLSNSEVDQTIEFVSNEEEMNTALDDDGIDTIVVTENIEAQNGFYITNSQRITAINEHEVTISLDDDSTSALFYVQSEGVTIEDLNIDRDSTEDVSQAIRVEESDVVIHNNVFDVTATASVTVQDDDDDENSDTTDIRITDNEFNNDGGRVSLLPALGSPGGENGEISDVTITGNDFNDYEDYGGVYVRPDYGTVEDVILTSNNFDSSAATYHVMEAETVTALDWNGDLTGIEEDNDFQQDTEFAEETVTDVTGTDTDYHVIQTE